MDIDIGFRHGIAVAVLLAMAGCSGGGGEGAPRPGFGFSPGGVSLLAGNWSGSATDTTTGKVMVANALIDDSGDAQLIVIPAIAILVPVPLPPTGGPTGGFFGIDAPFFVVHGNVCCEASFQGMASAESMGTGIKSTSQVSGSLSSGMLVGTFDFQGTPYSFSLAPNPSYNRALTLQDLAGVYTNLPDLFGGATTTYTIAVSTDGVVTGAHVNGCIYNGAVNIPNTSRNLFRLRMQISNCSTTSLGPRNGEYSGLGVLRRDVLVFGDPTTLKQIFSYSLIGPVWLGTQAAQR